MKQTNQSRRKFVKKMAYIPPAIATLTVLPAFHANGSGWEQHSGQHDHKQEQHGDQHGNHGDDRRSMSGNHGRDRRNHDWDHR